ncbi:hypothetical protein GF324_04225 [bacterium]|nr:hypothetical protein [bacterium]
MKRTWILVVGLLLVGVTASQAQPKATHGAERLHKIRERIETMKIYKLTEEVGFSEEQAAKFFPRYRAFENEMEELEIELRRTGEDMLRATEQDKSESEIRELLNKALELEEKRLQRQHKFLRGLDDVLSVKQQARLMIFEHRFHEKMREAIREHRGFGPPPPHPGFDHGPPQGRGR